MNCIKQQAEHPPLPCESERHLRGMQLIVWHLSNQGCCADVLIDSQGHMLVHQQLPPTLVVPHILQPQQQSQVKQAQELASRGDDRAVRAGEGQGLLSMCLLPCHWME